VVWLASRQSSQVTGRIIEAGGGVLGLMEGWQRGPMTDPVDDPVAIGKVLSELDARTRRNMGMNAKEHEI